MKSVFIAIPVGRVADWDAVNEATHMMTLNKFIMNIFACVFLTLTEIAGSDLTWAIIDANAGIVQFDGSDVDVSLIAEAAAGFGCTIVSETTV